MNELFLGQPNVKPLNADEIQSLETLRQNILAARKVLGLGCQTGVPKETHD